MRNACLYIGLCTATFLCGCSKPPDLERVLGHTPAEVRDYLGEPVASEPESEDYELRFDGEPAKVWVIYRNGKAVRVVKPLSSAWTEQQVTDWLGNNCTVEFERTSDGRLRGASFLLPCTPRVY
jgi:uncharacterized protein YcsI (UPF0317 family)